MIKLLANDAIEVITIKDTYRINEIETSKGIQEEYILVQKDSQSKKCIRLMDITEVSQLVSDYGYPISNRTQLDIRMKDPIVVVGRYQDFKNIVFDNRTDYSTNIGFK